MIVDRLAQVEPCLLAQAIQERAHLGHKPQLLCAQQNANDPHHPEPKVARGKSAHLFVQQHQVGLQLQSQSDGFSLTPIQVQAQCVHHPFIPDLMTPDP
jgi:hypothetical protein